MQWKLVKVRTCGWHKQRTIQSARFQLLYKHRVVASRIFCFCFSQECVPCIQSGDSAPVVGPRRSSLMHVCLFHRRKLISEPSCVYSHQGLIAWLNGLVYAKCKDSPVTRRAIVSITWQTGRTDSIVLPFTWNSVRFVSLTTGCFWTGAGGGF